jgi:hypothetical protein
MAPILTGTQTGCTYKHKVKNSTKSLVSCGLKAVMYNSLLSKGYTVQPALDHLHNIDLIKDNKVFSYVWDLIQVG